MTAEQLERLFRRSLSADALRASERNERIALEVLAILTRRHNFRELVSRM